MRVITILWLRQLKRYSRSKSRILGSLGQPVLFLLALGFGLSPVFQKAGQGDYLEFLAPGIIGMSIITTSVFSGVEIIWDRQFGFLKETLVAPVSRVSIVVGRTLGGATVATAQGVIVLCIASIVGFQPVRLALLPAALLVMFLIALLFTALGTTIGSLLDDMQGFQLIMSFLVMPLFFLSGALFPLTPGAVLTRIAQFDPLTYGVDALRALLNGVSAFSLALDLTVLVAVTAGILLVGTYAFSRIEA